IGQIKIADNHLKWTLGQKGIAGFRQSARRDRGVGPLAKAVLQQFPHLLVIIDYEDSIHCVPSRSFAVSVVLPMSCFCLKDLHSTRLPVPSVTVRAALVWTQ